MHCRVVGESLWAPTAIDRRTSGQRGYAISQRLRKRVEEIFGWAKTVGNFRRSRFKGERRTQLAAYFVAAAYNLTRMSRQAPMRAARSSPEGEWGVRIGAR